MARLLPIDRAANKLTIGVSCVAQSLRAKGSVVEVHPQEQNFLLTSKGLRLSLGV